MNFLDITIGILLLIGLIRGLMKGFIFEIAVIGALFLGTFAAFRLSYLVQPYVMKMGNLNPFTVNLVSSMLMLVLIGTGIFFLAKLFDGLVNMAALGVFNKILGAIFGLLKYAFVLSVLIYFFNQLDVRHHYLSADKKAESHLYYPVMKMAPSLLPLMKEMKKEISLKAGQTAEEIPGEK